MGAKVIGIILLAPTLSGQLYRSPRAEYRLIEWSGKDKWTTKVIDVDRKGRVAASVQLPGLGCPGPDGTLQFDARNSLQQMVVKGIYVSHAGQDDAGELYSVLPPKGSSWRFKTAWRAMVAVDPFTKTLWAFNVEKPGLKPQAFDLFSGGQKTARPLTDIDGSSPLDGQNTIYTCAFAGPDIACMFTLPHPFKQSPAPGYENLFPTASKYWLNLTMVNLRTGRSELVMPFEFVSHGGISAPTGQIASVSRPGRELAVFLNHKIYRLDISAIYRGLVAPTHKGR